MKKFLKTVPIPMCGLILGLASLGNLMKEYNSPIIGNLMGSVAGLLMLLILVKLFFLPHHTIKNLQDPIVASVAPTFTMAMMVLCTFLTAIPALSVIAKGLWLAAVVVQYLLIFYFTYTFVIRPSVRMEHVFPSWFIVYVGIGVIAVTSPSFSIVLGQINFWIALIFYLLILPIILYRVFIHQQMPEATLPLTTIVAAPGSLCLTGYLKAFAEPNMPLVIGLLILSQILYLITLFKVLPLRKINFYPSYAAFTFPLVISAIALATFNHKLGFGGLLGTIMNLLGMGEAVIATVVVFYVLGHYGNFLFHQVQKIRQEASQKSERMI